MSTPRRRKPDQLDALDAEMIRDTIQTTGWQLIKRGLESMRERHIRDLVRPQGELETAKLRGAIAAIDQAIAMPETIIAQTKNGAKS